MNKQSIVITVTAITSSLFYKYEMGINQVLISIILIAMLYYLNPHKFQDKRIINYTILHLFSGSMAFFYPSILVNISSIISFFILLGAITSPCSSIYIQILNGFYSSVASKFVLKYKRLQQETRLVRNKQANYLYWVKFIGIPLFIGIVFTSLYSQANPLFYNYIKKIDLSFIDLNWIIFNSLCFFIIYNISNPITHLALTNKDANTSNYLNSKKIKTQSDEKLKEELKLGIILLSTLNILIILYIIVDIMFLLETVSTTAAQLSKSVHEGIFALISSILLAISIILFFFRGNLNFLANNNRLKTLTFLWIILNTIIIITTALKNYSYISDFGFTYKRIGVFVYLILTVVGLLTTLAKVYFRYNLWYLIRHNTEIAFFILLLSTIINWDSLITSYNTQFASHTDIPYLIRLSDNNTIQLKQYIADNPSFFSDYDQKRILEKYNQYISKLEQNNWQEYVYDNLRQKHYLIKH